MVTLKIIEWDGDRSGPLGGFDGELTVAGQTFQIEGGYYDTNAERQRELAKIRNKVRRVAEELKLEVKEKLLD